MCQPPLLTKNKKLKPYDGLTKPIQGRHHRIEHHSLPPQLVALHLHRVPHFLAANPLSGSSAPQPWPPPAVSLLPHARAAPWPRCRRRRAGGWPTTHWEERLQLPHPAWPAPCAPPQRKEKYGGRREEVEREEWMWNTTDEEGETIGRGTERGAKNELGLGPQHFSRGGLVRVRLQKLIYEGGYLKMTTSENRQFYEAVVLKCPPS